MPATDPYHTYVQKDEKIMQYARDIVRRFRERGCTLPRILKPADRTTPAAVQESKDAQKIKNWKKSFKNMPGQSRLPLSVKEFLDDHLTGWRDITRAPDITDPPLDKAKAIVKRYYQCGFEFPLQVKHKYKAISKRPLQHISQSQEESGDDDSPLPDREDFAAIIHEAQRDHDRLRYWLSQEETNNPTDGTVQALRYCDLNMPGWRESEVLHKQANEIFSNIQANVTSHSSSSEADSVHMNLGRDVISKAAFCLWFRAFTEKASVMDKKQLKALSSGSKLVDDEGEQEEDDDDEEDNDVDRDDHSRFTTSPNLAPVHGLGSSATKNPGTPSDMDSTGHRAKRRRSGGSNASPSSPNLQSASQTDL